MEIRPKSFRAPEIYGDFWFNSDPLPLSALHGSVILIDFWDYTSIGCLRGIPYLVEWDLRYREWGLVVIGVHTPHFGFARKAEAVSEAINRLGIGYPVVTDNQYLIWNAFGSQSWPGRFLIDRDGYVRYYYFGEGHYTEIERGIQVLLVEAGFHGELPMLMEPLRDTDRPGAVCYRTTPEIYTGYTRGSIGNVEGLNLDSTIEYVDQGIHVDGHFYLNGRWFIERDFIRYDGDPSSEGYILISYHALEVNAVINPEKERDFVFQIFQDGLPLPNELKGDDVTIDEKGHSVVRVTEGKLYNLVRNREFGEHTLKLMVNSSSFGIYAFSFVSALIPEALVSESG